MKHYYFKNILNQIIKLKKDSLIIFTIIFSLSFVLSQIYFFGYNDSIESNIGNSLTLSHEIKNNHIFDLSQSVKLNGIEDKEGLFFDFIDFIETTADSEHVDAYNYNIILSRDSYLIHTDETETTPCTLYGISDADFVKKNQLKIIDGRAITQEEILNGKPVIVVSHDRKIVGEDGYLRPIRVGDQVKLVDLKNDNSDFPTKLASVDVEVVGIYQNDYLPFYLFGINDRFVNTGGFLVPNSMILNLLSKSNQVDYQNIKINRISFFVDDYENNMEFSSKLNSNITKFNAYVTNKYNTLIKLERHESNEDLIIGTIYEIKAVYRIVFFVVFLVILVLFISIIHLLLKKKTKEIQIYYSLGQSKNKIIFQYVSIYLIISCFAVLLALFVGYFTSHFLLEKMVVEKIVLQSDLLRYSSTGVNASLTNEKLLTPDYQFTWISSIKIFLEVVFIVSASVTFSMKIIMRQARKERS